MNQKIGYGRVSTDDQHFDLQNDALKKAGCDVIYAGSRYFCGSFYGHPCPTSGKNYATANAFGGPSRPASLVAYPARGMQHSYRNDSTRFRKACIFTTLCSVKTHALSLLGTTRLLSRSGRKNQWQKY
jgi:hypothetical protein